MTTALTAMSFIAIDVETANADPGSICQIGGCIFIDGVEIERFCWLVNPGEEFDPRNVRIHGIRYEDVHHAPSFAEVEADLRSWMAGSLVVAHGHFDRVALTYACEAIGVDPIDCRWLDSCKLARRAWPENAEAGYGLRVVADQLGIDFQHHDALEDARAAGKVAIAAMAVLAMTPAEAMVRSGQPVRSAQRLNTLTSDDVIGGGPLVGQRIVFTGALSICRIEAARQAVSLGATCSDSLSKKTTMLVIGGPPPEAMQPQSIGYGMTVSWSAPPVSGKHAKAQTLIERGAAIKIIYEDDFVLMCGQSTAA